MTTPSARAAMIAIATLLTASCSTLDAASPDDTPAPGGQLTYAAYREPDCLDPHVSPADVVGELQRNVFDSLVVQRQDGSFAPWLARSWEVSPDGRSYTFTLRDDVSFFDGAPFNAQAVKDNFDHIVAPETKSQYAVRLLGPYEGTDVVDAHTARVRFKEPYAPFLQAASTAYLGFYSPAALRDHHDELCSGGPNAVGSGPFRELKYTKGRGVEFARNETYNWAPATAKHTGPAHLQRLSVRLLTEDAVRTGSLLGGVVDVAGGLAPADIQQVRGDSSIRVTAQNAPGSPYTFYLNTAKEPLSDKRARQAVIAAIDVDGIVNATYLGEYQTARSPLSPSTTGYNRDLDRHRTYDPAKAQRLLDELGYTGRDAEGYRTKDGKRFTLVHPWASNLNREKRDLISQALQEDLKKAGIELVLQPVDSGSYLKQRNANGYDLIGFSWASSDPAVLERLYGSESQFSQGGANGSQVRDPGLDALLARGRETGDPAARAAAYRQAQQRIVDEAYSLPIYVYPQVYGASTRVHGFSLDANSWTYFYDTWVDHS